MSQEGKISKADKKAADAIRMEIRKIEKEREAYVLQIEKEEAKSERHFQIMQQEKKSLNRLAEIGGKDEKLLHLLEKKNCQLGRIDVLHHDLMQAFSKEKKAIISKSDKKISELHAKISKLEEGK